jgi:hypothetical protein
MFWHTLIFWRGGGIVVQKGSEYWNLVSNSFITSDSLEVEQILKVVPFSFANTLILRVCNLRYWFHRPFLPDLFILLLLFLLVFLTMNGYTECKPKALLWYVGLQLTLLLSSKNAARKANIRPKVTVSDHSLRILNIFSNSDELCWNYSLQEKPKYSEEHFPCALYPPHIST